MQAIKAALLLPSHWLTRVLLPSGHPPSEDGIVWDCVFNRRHPMAVWASRGSTFPLGIEAATPRPTADAITSEGGTKDRCCWPVSKYGLHTKRLLFFFEVDELNFGTKCAPCGVEQPPERNPLSPDALVASSCSGFIVTMSSMWNQRQHVGVWPFCRTDLYYILIKSGFSFWSQETENFVSCGWKALNSPSSTIPLIDRDVVQCLHWVFSLQIRESCTVNLIPTPSRGRTQVRSYCHGNLSNCNIISSRQELCLCRVF